MKKGKKVYKKFLSCVLAAAMVVTSGVVYPGNEKTAEALQKENFADGWSIDADQERVILDKQGVMYQLNEDGTATVLKFNYLYREAKEGDPIQSGIVTIPDTVPIDLTNYKDYKQFGVGAITAATARGSSTVTEIADEAFSGSSDLTKVEISGNVTSIGDKAFAFCQNLTEVNWKVAEGIVKINNEEADKSNAEIFEGSPKCVLSSDNLYVKVYAKNKGYTSPRTDNSQATPTPSASEPIQQPTATPTAVPSQAPAVTPSVTPVASPSVTPSPSPVATPTPSQVPTATPKVPIYYPPIVTTPSVEPATPTPAIATPPVEQTPTPGETTAPTVAPTPTPGETAVPTVAPTAVPDTPVPPSQKPVITEVPEPSSPVTTAAPSDGTAVPVPPTIAPTQSETVVKNNVTYEVEQNKKSVSVGDMKDVKSSSVTIPATVKVNGVSYPVTSVDKGAFKNNTNIKKVKLGKNIKNIEAGAFRGCKNLTSVSLPSNLQTVEKNSFNGCSSLKSIKLPKTVKKIGKAAFKDCTSMKNVSIGGNPKAKKGGLVLDGKQVCYGASTVTINIGEKAFENCKKLNKVIINALVKIIGKSAFKDCKSLRSVLIYSKVLKKVKGGALTGVHDCKISVPAKKIGPYKILFKNKGQGKKVVVAKL